MSVSKFNYLQLKNGNNRAGQRVAPVLRVTPITPITALLLCLKLEGLSMDFIVERGYNKKCLFTDEQTKYIIDLYKNGTPTSKIGPMFGVSYKAIERLLGKNDIPRTGVGRRKYKINETYFDEIDTPNKAYILGFLFADGCNFSPKQTVSMSLQEEDSYILEKMRLEIGSERPLEFIDYRNKHDFGYHYKDQYRLLLFSKHMCESLAKHGMVPAKSLILEFPDIPKELYSHFIRGYFDGDGSISLAYSKSGKPYASFSFTSTENFCNSLKNILINETGIDKIRIDDASCHNGITRILYVSNRDQIKVVLDWMYQDAELYLERKHDKYIECYYAAA